MWGGGGEGGGGGGKIRSENVSRQSCVCNRVYIGVKHQNATCQHTCASTCTCAWCMSTHVTPYVYTASHSMLFEHYVCTHACVDVCVEHSQPCMKEN